MILRIGGDGIMIGPILFGIAKLVYMLTATARRLVNMTALAVVDANLQAGEGSRL